MYIQVLYKCIGLRAPSAICHIINTSHIISETSPLIRLPFARIDKWTEVIHTFIHFLVLSTLFLCPCLMFHKYKGGIYVPPYRALTKEPQSP